MAKKDERKYLDVPAAKASNLGQNISILNSEMAAGNTNPTQTKRIQAINAATAPTTGQPKNVFSDPGGGGTLTTHGQKPNAVPRQAFKQDGYSFEGPAKDAAKFFAPVGKSGGGGMPAAGAMRAPMPVMARRTPPPAQPAMSFVTKKSHPGMDWQTAKAVNAAIAGGQFDLAKQAMANTGSAQTAAMNVEGGLQEQHLRNMGGIAQQALSNEGADKRQQDASRAAMDRLKNKPAELKVFPGQVIEERDPVTNRIVSRQSPPTFVNPETKTYEEAQPVQQYPEPTADYLEIMMANQGDPNAEAEFLRRFGKLPY